MNFRRRGYGASSATTSKALLGLCLMVVVAACEPSNRPVAPAGGDQGNTSLVSSDPVSSGGETEGDLVDAIDAPPKVTPSCGPSCYPE
ncbi:MAG: hypothetical protein ACT4OP_08895 [Actinomycetota bacterium]